MNDVRVDKDGVSNGYVMLTTPRDNIMLRLGDVRDLRAQLKGAEEALVRQEEWEHARRLKREGEG